MEALFETYNPVLEGRSGNWDVDLRNFLEFYLQELHNETNCSSMINFSQAAIVLQKSASVYEKKVDYLSQLVMQLLDVLQLSKSGTETSSNGVIVEQAAVADNAEPSTSKKNQARKPRSKKPYLFEEFNQINTKVSVKSLDLVEKTTSKPELTLTRSAVFGRMVNVKKKRQHELYVFDKNKECMGKKDDFRLSWSLNHFCVLVEDPFDDSVEIPPPVSERLNDPMVRDPLEGISSPVSPSSTAECADDNVAQDQAPTADGQGPDPPSPNQEVPCEPGADQVLNENPSQAVPVAQILVQEMNENPNQLVPEAQTPNVAGPSGSGVIRDVVLPDTPPDSQVLPDTPPDSEVVRNGPVVDVGTARLSIIEESDEVVAVRKSLRDRNIVKDPDYLYPLNFLFSSSLLETLDDSTYLSSPSMSESLRAQAKKVSGKGKRRFQEILDEEEGLAGFEEIAQEPLSPAEAVAQNTIEDLPQEEVPQLNVPVPTPPPTPSNSLPMSPDVVSRTPRSDVPETRCPLMCSPMGELPEATHSEAPTNVMNPWESTETDRSARVAAWHKSIKQRLEESNSRPPFDVHVYGSKVITSFSSVGSTLEFKDLVAGMDRWEISRMFLTSLMLANTENVEISLTDKTHLPADCMSLRLLSTQRHEEELEAFCAPSVDLHRRSNTESPVQGTSSGLVHRKRKSEQSAQSRSIPSKKNRA